MRVLLVAPPRRLWPYMNEQDNFLLPQSLACLAGALRHDGADVTVIDCLPERIGWTALERAIRRHQPDVVGAGENHALYASEVHRLVRLCKRIDPGMIAVLGGAHFTHLADRTLRDHPVDYVVRGEGEVTLCALVRALDTGGTPAARRVDGVSFLRDGAVVHNPPRALVEDLDTLPMPAYDLMPMQRYGRARLLFSPGGTTIHHSRGCSARCAFCVWWTQMADRSPGCDGTDELAPRWRTKSVERTLAEMEVLHERFGKRCLVFVDPSFNLDPDWNERFAAALIRRDWDLTWFAFMRTDCLLRDARNGVLDALVRSGLTHVCVGAERAEDEQLGRWNKRFHGGGETREAFRLLRERYPGVFRQATFILGVRDETPASMRRQLAFARELRLDYPAFHVVTPFPGTDLWARAQREGWLEVEDFDAFDMSTPVMGSDHMDRDEIERELIRLSWDYVGPGWLLRGLASRSAYRRNMYLWWLWVSGRVAADSLRARLNPLRPESYTGMVEPDWYA